MPVPMGNSWEGNVVGQSLNRAPKGLELFIRKAFDAATPLPALTTSNIMDYIFEEQNWWEFEPETIRDSLAKAAIHPSRLVEDQIQAIAALRTGKSFIDKEWHLFEKFVLSFHGIPVYFFERQNIPIEYIIATLASMKFLGPVELSEEVKWYIGAETLNDELLWHPMAQIDQYLKWVLDTSGKTFGFDMDEVDQLREQTKAKFERLKEVPLDKAEFNDSDPADMMCARLVRSLAIGNALMRREYDFLGIFEKLKSGEATFEGLSDSVKESLEPVKSERRLISERLPDNLDTNVQVEFVTVDMVPDTTEFEAAIKEAFIKSIEGASYYFKDIDKIASMTSGLPIITGANLSGIDSPDKDEPSMDLEKTAPVAGNTGPEKMRAVRNRASGEMAERLEKGETTHKGPGDGFNIFKL